MTINKEAHDTIRNALSRLTDSMPLGPDQQSVRISGERSWPAARRAAVLAAVASGEAVHYIGTDADLMDGVPGTASLDTAVLVVCDGDGDDVPPVRDAFVLTHAAGGMGDEWLSETVAATGGTLADLAAELRARYDRPDELLDLGDGLEVLRSGSMGEVLLGNVRLGPSTRGRDTWEVAADSDRPVEVLLRVIGGMVRSGRQVVVLDVAGDLPDDLHTFPGIAGVSRRVEEHGVLAKIADPLAGDSYAVVLNGVDELSRRYAEHGVAIPSSVKNLISSRPAVVRSTTSFSNVYGTTVVAEGDRLRVRYCGTGVRRSFALPPAPERVTDVLPATGDRVRLWAKVSADGEVGPTITLTDADGTPIPERAIYDPHSPEYIGRAPKSAEEQEGPTPRRTVRVPDAEWESAQKVAEAKGESISEVVRRCLAEYVAFADTSPRVYRAISTASLRTDPVVVEGITGTADEVRAAFPAAHWRVEYRDVTGYLPL